MFESHFPKIILAPSYYTRFRCIADRCCHSCCIDWEICIDERTLDRYRVMEGISETVTEDEDGASFALTPDGRCPHLNECGLCNIILAHGEDCLSDICRRHPRFFNSVGHGRMEVGLGLVCEEACRLILENDEPFSLVEIPNPCDGSMPDFDVDADGEDSLDYDPLPLRDAVLSAVARAEGHWDEAVAALRGTYAIPVLHSPAAWIDRFLGLEILDESWGETLQAARDAPPRDLAADGGFDPYFARLLVYFVYRHVSVATSPANARARLGFALQSVEMIRYLFGCAPAQTAATLAETARRYSAEIEYSEDNTDELIFAFECAL